jgi:hypothetical protein
VAFIYEPHPVVVVFLCQAILENLSSIIKNSVLLLVALLRSINPSSGVAMAEASSSGGASEGSEEEEDDEASPSHGGPVSTAASPRHTNKRKKLRYVQDYLLRVPKHQRRRIQKEIDKGYKQGETAFITSY